MSGARVVHAETEVRAPVDAVWNAWTTPQGVAAWLANALEGEVAVSKRIVWRRAESASTLEVVALDAPRRLTLALHRDGAPSDVIEVLLSARDDATALRLTQTGFVAEDPELEAEAASSSWKIALRVLRESLEANPGKPRASIVRSRTTGLALTQVVPWNLTRGGRSLWLPKEAQGEPVLLTTREALLAWPGVGGLLEAKVYPHGPHRTTIALRGHSWSKSSAELEGHAASFDKALEKLEALAAGKR